MIVFKVVISPLNTTLSVLVYRYLCIAINFFSATTLRPARQQNHNRPMNMNVNSNQTLSQSLHSFDLSICRFYQTQYISLSIFKYILLSLYYTSALCERNALTFGCVVPTINPYLNK